MNVVVDFLLEYYVWVLVVLVILFLFVVLLFKFFVILITSIYIVATFFVNNSLLYSDIHNW